MASRAASTACAVPRRSRWMNVAASGRRRLTSSATARWSGPMTTASEAPAPFGAASSTCVSSDWPATGCSTFGIEDCMRVPSPAASTMVRLVLPVIPNPCWLRQGLRRRHKAFLSTMEIVSPPGESRRIHDRGPFPVKVQCDSAKAREGRKRPMARDTDHLAGGFETENTGGFLSGLLAEEENLDRRSLLRLGAWGGGSAVALVLAGTPNQPSIRRRPAQ